DVRTAYWRAACAEKLAGDLRAAIALAETALADSRKVEAERVRNPMDALRYQRSLLENLRLLESIQQELDTARIELAGLIGLPAGTTFKIAAPRAEELNPQLVRLPVAQMEELAITQNADLREQVYSARIAV